MFVNGVRHAYKSGTAAVTRLEAVDVAGDVGEREVFQDHAGVVRSVGLAGRVLVGVGLGRYRQRSDRELLPA